MNRSLLFNRPGVPIGGRSRRSTRSPGVPIAWLAALSASACLADGPMSLRGAPDPAARLQRILEVGAPPSLAEPRATALSDLQSAVTALVGRLSPCVVAIAIDRSPAAMGEFSPADLGAWSGTGSGTIIRADGMILTSQHVIEDAIAIHVTLHDGRRLRGRVIAQDRRADLAVLQIAADSLDVAALGDVAGVRRGHVVFAMGNPLGMASDGQAAVSMGVVSAIGRPLPGAFGQEEDRYYGDMIQTSAPIHPGHSGGPLLDVEGRVVGVLTAISMAASGGEGIAFAVPIGERTRQIVARLMEGRGIEYGYLGVEVGTLTAMQSEEAGLASGRGVLVDSLAADGPAARAGLRRGDIILTVNEAAVGSADEFIQIVGAIEPGAPVELTYLREGRTTRTAMSAVKRPDAARTAAPPASVTFRGAVLGEVDPSLRRTASLPPYALLVLMVSADSPAGRAGLSPGDIIVQIDGQPLDGDSALRLAERADDCLLGMANGGSVLVRAK